jgi:primary-amine oxidase
MNLLRALTFLFMFATAAKAQEGYVPQHPMDALTPDEITRVVKIMRDAKLADDATLYPAITLHEMPKADVLSWKHGDPILRQAFVVTRENRETSESIVDIDNGTVLSHKVGPGVQPMISRSAFQESP